MMGFSAVHFCTENCWLRQFSGQGIFSLVVDDAGPIREGL